MENFKEDLESLHMQPWTDLKSVSFELDTNTRCTSFQKKERENEVNKTHPSREKYQRWE